MSTDLIPFTYQGRPVRTVVIDGEPWFVLADLCAVLDIGNPRNVAARLADDMKGVRSVDTPGGSQQMTIVSESGMYEVVIRSDKPEAIAFRRWITTEVLPQIRKTGSYGAPELPDVSTAAGVLAMAEQFTATARALVASESRVAELEPRAEVADRLLAADGDLAVADAAKALTRAGVKAGGGRLFKDLAARRWIYRAAGDGRWRVYQRAIETGYMSVIPQSHYHPKTGVLVLDAPQPRVTPKGLANLMRAYGVEPAVAS